MDFNRWRIKMEKSILKYRFDEQFEFNINKSSIVTIVGNSNNRILNNLLWKNKKGNIFIDDIEVNDQNFYKIHRNISFVLYKHLNIFAGETVQDEIAFGLESLAINKIDIKEKIESEARNFGITDILKRDPNSLGSSDKALMKILCSLIINPKILVLDNILTELDFEDINRIKNIFKDYISSGGTVINITNNIEEALLGDRVIVVYDMKLALDDKTKNALKEEKLFKRLGLGLPFITELSNYLIDYKLIDKYYTDYKKLVNDIWK